MRCASLAFEERDRAFPPPPIAEEFVGGVGGPVQEFPRGIRLPTSCGPRWSGLLGVRGRGGAADGLLTLLVDRDDGWRQNTAIGRGLR